MRDYAAWKFDDPFGVLIFSESNFENFICSKRWEITVLIRSWQWTLILRTIEMPLHHANHNLRIFALKNCFKEICFFHSNIFYWILWSEICFHITPLKTIIQNIRWLTLEHDLHLMKLVTFENLSHTNFCVSSTHFVHSYSFAPVWIW